MSRDMTKPTKWVCAQRRLRSACSWASAQSDQSLRCPHEETLGPLLPTKRTAKTLIRLGGCPGWSESLLGAHAFCWFCHEAAHICSVMEKLNHTYETTRLGFIESVNEQWWLMQHCSRAPSRSLSGIVQVRFINSTPMQFFISHYIHPRVFLVLLHSTWCRKYFQLPGAAVAQWLAC